MDFSDTFNSTTCEHFSTELHGQDWKITTASKAITNTSACLFGLVILFQTYVFVKYLVVRAGCQRVAMMVFYFFIFADLFTRMAIMISLSYRPFFATENLILSVCSLLFALLVGTSHAWILISLIIDLRVLKCEDVESYQAILRKDKIYKALIISWMIAILACTIFFFVDHKYE